MKNSILIHEPMDDVGVAVADLKAGEEIGVVTLEGVPAGQIKLVSDVPLGHKVAMHDLPADKHIIEYGRAIGYALAPIQSGEHVHIHNIRSLRWAGKPLTIEN
jgi:(2R)-sulfolactate sulfo-lyase subunit alpha